MAGPSRLLKVGVCWSIACQKCRFRRSIAQSCHRVRIVARAAVSTKRVSAGRPVRVALIGLLETFVDVGAVATASDLWLSAQSDARVGVGQRPVAGVTSACKAAIGVDALGVDVAVVR